MAKLLIHGIKVLNLPNLIMKLNLLFLSLVVSFRCSETELCPGNECCSQWGWCGTTVEYCDPVTCLSNCWKSDDGPVTGPGVVVPIPVPGDKVPDDQDENPWYDSRGVFSSCNIKGTMALTFDDGPSQFTSKLLETLEKHNIKATFFVIGKYLADGQYANSVLKAYKAGHLIGSHTWDHSDLVSLSDEEVVRQMTQTAEAIRNVIGVEPKYMRPPYG